jgi:hypothetical protein
MPEMKTLNGYEIVDAKARDDISKINIPDLGDYAKKSDIPTVPTRTSQLTNDSGFITSIPSTYVTETELSAKGYLTSVPSEYVTDTELTSKGYLTSSALNGYATESYVDAAVANAGGSSSGSGHKVITIKYSNVNSLTSDEKSALLAIGKSIKNSTKFPDGYTLMFKIPNNEVLMNVTKAYTRSTSSAYYVHYQSFTNDMIAELEVSYNTSVSSINSVYIEYSYPSVSIPDTYATKTYVDEVLGVIENGTY